MIPRVAYAALGTAFWMTAYDKNKDSPKLDVDRVDSSKTFVYTSILAMTAIGVLLDIACLRYKSLRRWIFHSECIYTIFYMMVPWDFGDFETIFITIYCLLGFILLSSKMHVDIILVALTMLCIQFGSQLWVSSQELTYVLAAQKITNTVFLCLVMTIFAVCVTYIAILKGRLANVMRENIGLLDKMTEGLMVLSNK